MGLRRSRPRVAAELADLFEVGWGRPGRRVRPFRRGRQRGRGGRATLRPAELGDFFEEVAFFEEFAGPCEGLEARLCHYLLARFRRFRSGGAH